MAKSSTSQLKRRLDIAEIVRKNGEVKVDDLAEMLAVSGVTIRNDLNYLEQQGYLKRSFGGAIYTAQTSTTLVGYEVPRQAVAEKSVELELAKQIARLVADRETVFVGAGDVLRKAIAFLGEKRELCLVVNDLGHVAPARDYVDGGTAVLGGTLGQGGQVLEGPLALHALRQFNPSRCLVLVDHISDIGVLNVLNESTAQLLTEVIRRSQHCVVVVANRPVYGALRYAIGQLQDVSAVVMPQIVAAEYHSCFTEIGLSNSYTNNDCLTWTNPTRR